MAAMTVTCKAAANFPQQLKQASPLTPQPKVNGVPLTQQFHWVRPQSAAFATASNALSSPELFSSSRYNFVRPDLVDAADDALAAFVQKTNRPSGSSGKPQFRSALEQVSYETNSSLMETRQAKPRGSSRGLLSRFLKK